MFDLNINCVITTRIEEQRTLENAVNRCKIKNEENTYKVLKI